MKYFLFIIFVLSLIGCTKDHQEREIIQKVERYGNKVFYPDTILWQAPYNFAFINIGLTDDYVEAVYYVDRMKIYFDDAVEVQHLSNYPVKYRIELLDDGFNIIDDSKGEVSKYR